MRRTTPPASTALYAFERAGRGDLRRLNGQVRRLPESVAARPRLWATTYADRGGIELFARSGIARLLYDASYC